MATGKLDGYDVFTGEVVGPVRFFTQYVRPVADSSERLPTTSKTERAYIPPEAQIKEMMASGERLRLARMRMYAPADEVDQEELPPQPGDDLVDVQRQAEALSARLEAQQAAAEKASADAAAVEKAAADKAALDAAVEAEIARRPLPGPPEGK